MKINTHFLKIILPNWILASVAAYILLTNFSWLYVLYSVLGFYIIGMIGGSIGFHRYLSHQSFKTSRFWESVLIILGSMTGQGSPIFWVGLHKFHHKHPDTKLDVHSPSNGIINAFILWQIKPVETIPSLANRSMYVDPLIKFIHRNYYKCYWGAVLIVYAIDPMFGLFFVSAGGWFLFNLVENTGNVISHHPKLGYRNYDLSDNSNNNILFAYLTLGGGWHNNHHRWPGNYQFGEKWWELDISAKLIRLIKK